MSTIQDLLGTYGESPQLFSVEVASKAIEESFGMIDDLLSENESENDKMTPVFTIIDEILRLCRISNDLVGIMKFLPFRDYI